MNLIPFSSVWFRILYVQEGLEGTPAVYFDPSSLSPDGSVHARPFFIERGRAIFCVFRSGEGLSLEGYAI